MPDCQTELVFPQFNQCVRYIKFSQAISTWRGMHIYVTHCSEVLMMLNRLITNFIRCNTVTFIPLRI